MTNPFLQTENFADAWTEDQYTNFREKIHKYREWIDEAYDEQDRAESIGKWRRVFGEDFASGVVLDEGKSVSKALVADARRQIVEAANFAGDLVDAIKRLVVASCLRASIRNRIWRRRRGRKRLPISNLSRCGPTFTRASPARSRSAP